jgi:hypothetical protein
MWQSLPYHDKFLENSHSFFLNHLTEFSYGIWEFIEYPYKFLIETVLSFFFFCWGMNVQNNDMTQAVSQYMYNIL